MKIVRIGKDKELKVDTDRISFTHDGEKYTITPEFKGFRIHKHSLDDGISIYPGCHNEIVVR